MADVKDGFNHDLDLITEKETVYDFVSRLSIGKDWIDPDLDAETIIFNADTNLKNILRQMAKCFPTSIYENLSCIVTRPVYISAGGTSAGIEMDSNYKLILAISERTGFDVTECFDADLSDDETCIAYTMGCDVGYEHDDIFRFYFIDENGPIS